MAKILLNKMIFKQIKVGPMQNFSYLIGDEESKEAAVIDSGWDADTLISIASKEKLKINIILAQSIIKSQKQDFLIQKATELGVRTIIPFISKNTVVKFDSEKDKLSKVQRWQKIVYESAKQCKRGDLAEIKPVSTFDEVINLEGYDLKIVCSEKEDAFSIKQFLSENKVAENADILLVIGPEGGWSNKEINKFVENGFASVTLGKLIYRAETAATVAISHIIYEYEL